MLRRLCNARSSRASEPKSSPSLISQRLSQSGANMSWKRAFGSVAAQTGACGALLSLPDNVRDDVGVAPGVAAIYGAGVGTCYALRPVAAESIAARVAWYGVFAGPVSGSLAMAVAAYAASLILPPTSPLPPEGQARLTAALQERDLGSLAARGTCRRRRSRTCGTRRSRRFWRTRPARDRVRALRAGRGADPAPARGARRLKRAAADLGGGEGFEGVALALVAAVRGAASTTH